MNKKLKLTVGEIINEPYMLNKRKISSKSIIVKIDDRGPVVKDRKYAYIEAKEVYKWIKDKKEVDLSNCYVKNLNFQKYFGNLSIISLIQGKNPFEINKFIAQSAFFDCDEGEKISFGSANFKSVKYQTFDDSIFAVGDKDFSYIKSDAMTISFLNVYWNNGNIDFSCAEFNSKEIIFANSVFGQGNIWFGNNGLENAELSFYKATFYSTRINRFDLNTAKLLFQDVIADDTYFDFSNNTLEKETLNFSGARITGNVKLNNCHFDGYTNLRFGSCESLTIRNSINRDVIDLLPNYTLSNINRRDTSNIKLDGIHNLNIVGLQNIGRIILDWKSNPIKEIIQSQTDTSAEQKAEQFLIFKENFHTLGRYNDEDSTYVEFKRWQAKAKIEKSNKKSLIKKVFGYFRYFGNRFVFDFVGGYGTKPKNVFRFMVIIIFGFSPFYAFIPNFLKWEEITKHFCTIEFFNKLLIGLYHSMITFLTIGYGDIEPKSVYGSLLSGIEGFIGLFLMAYFTIAFSRKVLR